MKIKVSFLVVFLTAIFLLLVFPLPKASALVSSITLEPAFGTVRTEVTVRGTGFRGSLATIYYDKQEVASRIRISEAGEFSASFNVPVSFRGSHLVKAVDNANPVNSSAEATFKVLPQIKVQPNVAKIGTGVTVIGTGFAESERAIKVTLDGKPMTTFVTASQLGSWSYVFDIPVVSKGDHTIGASGEVTGAVEVPEVILTIGPVVRVTPTRGPVGTRIQFSGFGFAPGEDGVSVIYQGKLILYNVVANIDGSWEASLDIPPSSGGIHKLIPFGTFTPIGTAPSLTFEVIPKIKLAVDSGKVGDEVKVTGTGFASSGEIKLKLGHVEAGSTTCDALGNFETTFKVPEGKGGESKVTATDGSGNSAQANFTWISKEETPPPAPQTLSPKGGSRIRVFSSAIDVVYKFAKTLKMLIKEMVKFFSPSAIVSFYWEDVTDPSGVSYTFQLADSGDFSSLFINKEQLTSSKYVLSVEEALAPGNYYWRVRAVDGAGNVGEWTEAQQFEVKIISIQSLVILIVGGVILLGLLVFGFIVWWMRRSYYYY